MNLLQKTIEIRDIERKQNEALKAFSEVMYPDTYTPFSTQNILYGFLEGIKLIDEDLYNDLQYYLYEADSMEEATFTTKDWKSYNFCKDDEVQKYLEDNYNYSFIK